MMDEFALGNVVLRQRVLGANEEISRPYDIVIAGLSWESRGLFALRSIKEKETAVTLLKFKSRSPKSEALKQERLSDFQKIFPRSVVMEVGGSTETNFNFPLLKSWLQDIYSKLGRPLSVLLDVTCIPKTYVLFLIGLGFTDELFARCDCLYSPGRYDLSPVPLVGNGSVSGPRSLLSEGEWTSIQIPYLESNAYIANDCDLIVTLGGELGLSIPFIDRHEPKRLALIFIRSDSDEVDMVASEKLAYEQLRQHPSAVLIDAGVCKATEVARQASRFANESGTSGLTALAIGAKPHAIALAILALGHEKVEVVCRAPASYREVDVPPAGSAILYEIEDRFDPAAYLTS
jgi:hypothetical protein